MKKLLYVFIAIFMVSCGTNTSKSQYEKTITGSLLKGSDTKENLNFKIVELKEIGQVTAADSIDYLTDEFKKDKQLIVKRIELAKKMTQELLSKTKKQTDTDKYKVDIVSMDNTIDSLKNLKPDNLNGYDKRNADDVLAVIIRCKYSIQPPGSSVVEETFDFYLSPDGTTFYGKKRAK